MAMPTWLSRLLMPMKRAGPAAPTPGLRAWRGDLGGTEGRLHLRVEPDGTGLLLINASSAVQLTPTGVLMAQGMLDEARDEAILATLARSYDGSQSTMAGDLAGLRALVTELATTPGGAWPIRDQTGGSSGAPLEVWVQVGDEADVIATLDRLMAEGVPHVTLMPGPEPSTLVRAVEHAEDLGMVCGARVLASGLDLSTLDQLAAAGLDCLQIPILSPEADVHDALLGAGDHAAALALLDAVAERDVCAVAELPLLGATRDAARDVARTVALHGCGVLTLWAIVDDGDGEAELNAALLQIGDEIPLVLHTPGRPSSADPAAQIRKGPRAGEEVQ